MLRLEKQILWYLIIILTIQFTFRIFDWSGELSTTLVMFSSIIFSLINIGEFIRERIKNSNWEYLFLLTSILYFFINLKIGYSYYNLFLLTGILIFSSFVVLNKRLKRSNIKKRLTVLLLINLILLLIPDVCVLSYINSLNNTVWGKEITWENFSKKDPDFSGKTDARMASNIRYKLNYVYNIPRSISVTIMKDSLSGVRPENRIDQSNLLKHERLHFDIAEWTRRDFQDSLDKVTPISDSLAFSIYKHFKYIWAQRSKEYDSITVHGTNSLEQEKWDRLVKEKLE